MSEQYEYALLLFQQDVPTSTPADLHVTLDQLSDTMNKWGASGWMFPETALVTVSDKSYPNGIGYRLVSLRMDAIGLIARRLTPALDAQHGSHRLVDSSALA